MKQFKFYILHSTFCIYVLTLYIIHCALYIASAQTLTDTELYLVRGDAKTFELNYYGDVTTDELLFVVKKDTAVSSPRLIQKRNTVAGGNNTQILATYNRPFTKIKILFYPIDTEDLLRSVYKFDLTRTDPADSNDHTHLFVGDLNLTPTISTPGDGSNVPLDGTRFYFVGLDSSNKNMGVALFDDNTNQVYYINFDELGDSMDIVTRNTKQNILAQKNFLGLVKFGADTFINVGGSYGGVRTGLIHNERPGVSQYNWEVVFSPDTFSAPWRIGSLSVEWDPLRFGKEWSYAIEFNSNGESDSLGSMSFAMEPLYEVVNGTDYSKSKVCYEWWFGFQYPDITNYQYDNRPFMVAQWVPYSGNTDSITAGAGFLVDEFSIGNRYDNWQKIKIETPRNQPGFIRITDTISIYYELNNLGWLYQVGPGGNPIEMMRINPSSDLVLYPFPGAEYGTFVRIGSYGVVGRNDSIAVRFGNYSRETNGIGIIAGTYTTHRGGFYYNDDNLLFGLIANTVSDYPDSWYSLAANDQTSKANLFLGGNLGLGTKTFGGSGTTSLTFGATDYVPNTISNQVFLYNVGGELIAKNGSGVTNQLTGSVSFASISLTDKITSPKFQGTTVVINSSTPTDVAFGAGFMCYVRDNSAGGTALVIYENVLTPIIVNQIGTVFTTSAPGANEIQLIGDFVKMSALAGTNMNGHQLGIIVLKPSD